MIITEIDLNYFPPQTVKIRDRFDNNTEKEFENKPLILYHNNINDFQSNNRYNISKKNYTVKTKRSRRINRNNNAK